MIRLQLRESAAVYRFLCVLFFFLIKKRRATGCGARDSSMAESSAVGVEERCPGRTLNIIVNGIVILSQHVHVFVAAWDGD